MYKFNNYMIIRIGLKIIFICRPILLNVMIVTYCLQGKSLPSMRLEWRKPEVFDDRQSIKSNSTATTMTGRYMGVVKNVRRVRKLQVRVVYTCIMFYQL